MEEYQDRSLRGRVFRHLREDILNGVYKDHEELREVTIGEELGVRFLFACYRQEDRTY